MNRQPVLTGYHPHAHHQHHHPHHPHQQQQQYRMHSQTHYGVPAASHYESSGHSALAFARPLPMRAPVLPPAGFNHQLQHQHGRPATFAMADPTSSYMATDEELAQLQKLSSEYEPEVTGPLVGERQSSSAITTQYANADPIFRIKTAALPAKYAFFRTCRGDGHCGWRAIAFTYFEALVRVGDASKFHTEHARLDSLGNLLEHVGYPRDIWFDFAEPVFQLLESMGDSLGANLDTSAAADMLLQKFNDPNESMAIITYIKLLTSAWVQTHADNYVHFMPDGDVKGYCSINIEPQACEADHIGIAALTDALVKPAGFGLEIWYLDRSPGEEINRSFHSEPMDQNYNPIPDAPMLRLLYRPGHYDILYKSEDVPQPPPPPQHPIATFTASYLDDFVPRASHVSDIMTMLPGMFPAGPGVGWASLSNNDFSPSPASQTQSSQPYPPVATPITPVSPSHLDFDIPLHMGHASRYEAPSHHSIHLDQPPVALPIHSAPPPPITLERVTPAVERGGPFRPSVYQMDPGYGSLMPTQPLQTSIFRNSHFNTAHFMNPDFQPEEWCPDGEYAGNKGRHKSHPS